MQEENYNSDMTSIQDKIQDIYQNFIYTRTYSRWIDELNRREKWPETVERYGNFMLSRIPNSKKAEFKKACEAIVNKEVMPSMRSLWTAGKALERENICGYNCSGIIVDHPRVFSETLYILMCGTGLGFSVERQFVNKLPNVPENLKNVDEIIPFADSKLGWAKGYNDFIRGLYDGKICKCDFSKIRPVGERLKVFGGRASGPQPLKELIEFTTNIFQNSKGRKLNSLECHDLMCKIASVVIVGGNRRSALISLSNLSDDRMRHAKDGQFWDSNPQRMLSNNSAVYTEKPDSATFLAEWLNLIRSKSGERGIFNRESSNFIVSQSGRRKTNFEWITNPCSEIILRPNEFCNLSTVIIRPEDDLESLKKKVRFATILGCVQSTLTDFNFINRNWKKNCEEERLLGVSLTGLRDHKTLGHKSRDSQLWLTSMKQMAVDTAKEWSEVLEINMPAAITCIKPEGSTSQLTNTSSGLHPRYAPYYIRRVRVAVVDPICKFLIDNNIPNHPEVGQTDSTCSTRVFEFPIKSPDTAVMNDDVSAIEQLEYWKMLQKYWCEHKPSCTIFVKDDEWLEVGSWVYKNWNYVSGVSFLPFDGGVYKLAPYEPIDEETYEKLIKEFPFTLNFDNLTKYEIEDTTLGAQELACSSGSCEII